MYRTVLLKLFCSFVVLEIVSTQNNFGEVINKMRTNDKELNPGWVETYLETLKNLGLPEPVSVSDLRSLQKLLVYLNEAQSQILQTNIDAFLKLFIHNGFNFQNLLKSAREPRKIKVIVEDEGSGSSEETMEEEDSPKLELLYQLFDDFIQLKRKLIDILKKLPLLIEMMDENNGEMNEQSTKVTKVQESTSLLSRKIQWIREKAQNITEILSQVPLLEYIRNLRDYLGQQSSPAEMQELESEIEDLLKEFEESEEIFSVDLDELDEVVNDHLEIENYKSRDMSQEQTTQSIPEELETEETTTETNRKARKLFEKIITEEKEKNKDGEFVKVWRKTIKIFSKDEAKDHSKETSSDKDEKWKEEIYNKVFKGDAKNELIVDQTQKVMKESQTNTETENLAPSGETMKENVFEKIFGNKEEMKMGENEKGKVWKIKTTQNIIDGDSATDKNKHEKVDDNKKQNLQDGAYDKEVKQIHKEKESEDNSWKKNFYDKIRTKTEVVGNKTNNITNYIGSITDGFYTAGNESQLKKIIEGIRSSKEDLTKTIGEKFNTVTNVFQINSQASQPDESKTKSESEEKWSFGNLNDRLINAKGNFTEKIKETFDNVKPKFDPVKIGTSNEDSKVVLKKSKLGSLSVSAEESKHEGSPLSVTVTSTYYTVLLTTTTQNVIFEKTVTYTSTEVLETRLSPTTTHTKNLQLKTKAKDQYHTPIKSSSLTKDETETESGNFKHEILDKFKNLL